MEAFLQEAASVSSASASASATSGTQTELDLYFQLDPTRQDIVQDWFDQKRTCRRCHERYYEYQNIGQWKCRQHARVREEDPYTGRERWSCCLASVLLPNSGCVPADHDEDTTRWHPEDDREIPLLLLRRHISVRAEAMVSRDDPAEQQHDRARATSAPFVLVRRYDWRREREIRRDGPRPRVPYVRIGNHYYAHHLVA